jgi:predicted house-cleaning noncanonical NTP pyrophosphatase (MazG superfamily)
VRTGDDDSLQELADVLEVVYALAEDIGAGRERLETVRAAKAARNGAFTKRLVWSGNTTGTD